MERYTRNQNMISESEQDILLSNRVAVIGCGGLGGNVIEMLARIGVGSLVLVDFDKFTTSNLNRQLLSKEGNIGKFKIEEAKKRVAEINSDINVITYNERFDKINATEILMNCDVVIDCLDNIETRFTLEKYATKVNIPLIHGAISSWYGQVTTILPNDMTLNKIYSNESSFIDKSGNPAFTPSIIASIQVSECIKLLLNKGDTLRHKLLVIDLLLNTFNVIEL